MGNKKIYSIRAGLDMRPESRFYQVLSETEETYIIDMSFGNKQAQRQYEIRKDALYQCEDILHQPMLGDDIDKLKEEWDRAVKKETVNVVAKLTKLMINAQPQGKESRTPPTAAVNEQHVENPHVAEKPLQPTPKRNRQPNFTSPSGVESAKAEAPVIPEFSQPSNRLKESDTPAIQQPTESAKEKPAAEVRATIDTQSNSSGEGQESSGQKNSNNRQQAAPQEATLPRNTGILGVGEKIDAASPEAERGSLSQKARDNEPKTVEDASPETAQMEVRRENKSVVPAKETKKVQQSQSGTILKSETRKPSADKAIPQPAEGGFPRACRLSWEEIDGALNRWVAKVFPTDTHVLPHAEMETSDAYSAGWNISLIGLRSEERALMELILGAHDVRKEINLNKEWPAEKEEKHNITLSQLISEHLMGSEILPSLKKPFTFGVSISIADASGVIFISK